MADNYEWQAVQKTAYNVGIAKAPVGTIVFNDLEQVVGKGTPDEHTLRSEFTDRIPQLAERPFLTAMEATRIQRDDPELYAALTKDAYVAAENNVVICGTRGEMWVAKEEKAQKTYTGIDWDKLGASFEIAHTSASSDKVMVRPAEEGEVIETSWGAKLVAGKGDWITSYDFPENSDCAVLNGEVGAVTYEKYGTEHGMEAPTNVVPLPNVDLYGNPAMEKAMNEKFSDKSNSSKPLKNKKTKTTVERDM